MEVALAGGAIGFSLALLETWLGKRGEDAEMQRSGRKRRRRTARTRPAKWAARLEPVSES